MASAGITPVTRRHFALKRHDGEPLTRADLQYDVLASIFADNHQVFSNPRRADQKLTFRDLYVDGILSSSKCSKATREKLNDLPVYATDFAMLTLLANLGRIGTGMSFFTETRTSLRGFHPVPALQRTQGSLQDVPRLRAIVRCSALDGEPSPTTITPEEIRARAIAGQIPPVSIGTLLTVLSNHSHSAASHFGNQIEFLDIFLPSDYSSPSRARAFLWLCYHYLQSSASANEPDELDPDNPFSDREHPGQPPALVPLTAEETVKENIDTEEEKSIAEQMLSQHNQILGGRAHSIEETAVDPVEMLPSTSKRKSPTKAPTHVKATRASKTRNEDGQTFEHKLDLRSPDRSQVHPDTSRTKSRRRTKHSEARYHEDSPEPPSTRYAPYQAVTSVPRHRSPHNSCSMLQYAWHSIRFTDPLCDSDDERESYRGLDRWQLYDDYSQRLRILNSFRGGPPTPDLEQPPTAASTPSR